MACDGLGPWRPACTILLLAPQQRGMTAAIPASLPEPVAATVTGSLTPQADLGAFAKALGEAKQKIVGEAAHSPEQTAEAQDQDPVDATANVTITLPQLQIALASPSSEPAKSAEPPSATPDPAPTAGCGFSAGAAPANYTALAPAPGSENFTTPAPVIAESKSPQSEKTADGISHVVDKEASIDAPSFQPPANESTAVVEPPTSPIADPRQLEKAAIEVRCNSSSPDTATAPKSAESRGTSNIPTAGMSATTFRSTEPVEARSVSPSSETFILRPSADAKTSESKEKPAVAGLQGNEDEVRKVIPTSKAEVQKKTNTRNADPDLQPDRTREETPPSAPHVAVESKACPSCTSEAHLTDTHVEQDKEPTASSIAAHLHPQKNSVPAEAPAAVSGNELAPAMQHLVPTKEGREANLTPSETALRSPAAAAPETAPRAMPPSPVHLSRLAGNAQQCEMHIGLRTTVFGTVEVHTFVRDNAVGVSIGSDRSELRQWISSELPSLAANLRQQDLRLDNLQFFNPETHASLDASSQFSQQQPGWTHQHPMSRTSPELSEVDETIPAALPETSANQDGRLNLHA